MFNHWRWWWIFVTHHWFKERKTCFNLNPGEEIRRIFSGQLKSMLDYKSHQNLQDEYIYCSNTVKFSSVVKILSSGSLIPVHWFTSLYLDTNQKITDWCKLNALLADWRKVSIWFTLFHSLYAVTEDTVCCVYYMKRLTTSECLNFLFHKCTFLFLFFLIYWILKVFHKHIFCTYFNL